VRVRICWEALQRLDTDYTVFVHLLGPENMRTAERHTYPGLGRYPTTLWEMGKTFCDTYRLQIETWAPTPVLYNVEAGLFDAETGARLPTTNALGQSVEPPIVGAVAIYEEDTQSSPGAVLDVIFGDQIQLVGVNIPRRGAPGEALRVILHWKVLAKPERGLKMFVHLWQPGSAEPFAQDDGIPNQGWFPTDVWEKGIYVTDPHDIRLPADLPPGIYPLWAGIYRAADGTRLRAVGPEGPITDDLVQLGEIQIQ
jgi:hypothetical protein